MNRRQEFVDWARARFAEGQSEYAVAAGLKRMNAFYLWVFDHLGTIYVDQAMAVEAWAIVRDARPSQIKRIEQEIEKLERLAK